MTKSNTRTYSDFDLGFKPHPLTGDVQMRYDEAAIKRSVYHLVNLNKFEKPFRPEIHGGVRDLLFEPMGQGTAIDIESRIKFVIQQHEPRVKLVDVTVTPNYVGNSYDVTITYTILNTLNTVEQKIFLQRVR